MPARSLPERPSLEFLKKLAKERLAALRKRRPGAKLAETQLELARTFGFPSWRALKAEVDRRNARGSTVAALFAACAAGDAAAVRTLLEIDPALVHARHETGGTALHAAAGHPGVVRVLLAHGADPNARDVGDHASPLHFAAASKNLESVRLLLDAGADVHGHGDVHDGDVIGWASGEGNEAVRNLLIERGARHHIFSAMALGDLDLVRQLVADDPAQLSRRRSRFEDEQTPLHMALGPPDGLSGRGPQHAMLSLLIELGAELEGRDAKGRTALEVAMLRGDRDAVRILRSAGALTPKAPAQRAVTALGPSIKRFYTAMHAPDMKATLAWYTSIGFKPVVVHEEHGELDYLVLEWGTAGVHFSRFGKVSTEFSLWFYTNRLDDLHAMLKERQLRAMQHQAGNEPEVRFSNDVWVPPYGGRQFSVLDNNGVTLEFYEPDKRPDDEREAES